MPNQPMCACGKHVTPELQARVDKKWKESGMPNQQQDWEKEFADKFKSIYLGDAPLREMTEEIERFIRSTRHQAVLEYKERVKESLHTMSDETYLTAISDFKRVLDQESAHFE